jgi:hypothetical protein
MEPKAPYERLWKVDLLGGQWGISTVIQKDRVLSNEEKNSGISVESAPVAEPEFKPGRKITLVRIPREPEAEFRARYLKYFEELGRTDITF